MKPKSSFETGKWICTKLLWNMAVWSSSNAEIKLRYGDFGMDSNLALAL